MLYKDFWFQAFAPTLPTVFSPELSYLELVKKVEYSYWELRKNTGAAIKNINCYIKAVEDDLKKLEQMFYNHNDKIYSDLKQYVDNTAAAINAKIERNKNDINAKTDAINASLSQRINANYMTLVQRIQQNYDNIMAQLDIIDAKIPQALAACKAYTDAKVQGFDDKLAKLKGEIDAFVTGCNDKFLLLQQQINLFELDYVKFKLDSKAYIDKSFADALKELKDSVAQLNGDLILVTNPKAGRTTTLRQALADVYSGLYWGRITAKEYDGMHLNASQYDSRKITAIDYDTHARFIFFDDLYMRPWWQALQDYQEQFLEIIKEISDQLTMRNPVTGRIDSMKQVIYDIVDKLHSEFKLTANEYDHLNLQTAAYDAMRVTAFEYDFYAKKYLGQTYISVKP